MENATKDDTLDRARELPKLARRYSHNQTLRVLVNLSLFFLAFAVIAGFSSLAGSAGRAGHVAAAIACCAVALAACAVWIWLVATPRLAAWSAAVTDRLCRSQGTVVADAGPSGRSRAPLLLALAFVLCVILSVAAGFASETANRYWLPITAAYSVPFLLYIWAKQGGMAAPFMLLWPGLLAAHALLALAGVRPFTGEPNGVNVLALFAYGAAAALASHVYSRFVLRRLRRLARDPQAGGGPHA